MSRKKIRTLYETCWVGAFLSTCQEGRIQFQPLKWCKKCCFSRPARETCHQDHEMEEVPTGLPLEVARALMVLCEVVLKDLKECWEPGSRKRSISFCLKLSFLGGNLCELH